MRAVLLLTLLAASLALATAVSCGGNCPSGGCPGCPCGSTPVRVNIAAACTGFSGWNQGQCQCIVSHESGGNANAMNWNARGGTYDVGVWQVNTINWNACAGGHPPCPQKQNLGCAIDVWRWGGGTFKLWSTCGSCGACARGLAEAEIAINPEWDGTYPEWYDATRPFPEWALNTTDVRIMQQKPALTSAIKPIILTEQ